MNIKKIIFSLALVILVVFACTACGDEEVESAFEFEFKSDGTYILTSVGTVNDADIVIPSTHNNLPVSTIGSGAFKDCKFLRTVTIPDSVTSIESNAFGGCTKLKELNLPDSITSISASAFDGTGYYNDSDNWEGDLLYYGEWLLASKKLVSGECVVKDGIKYMADFTFYGCANLTSVVIPEGVERIGTYMFGACVSLEKVTIPESVKSIGMYAFSNCMKLSGVTLPEDVVNIGAYAFEGCETTTINCSFTSDGLVKGDSTKKVTLGKSWNDDVASTVYYEK